MLFARVTLAASMLLSCVSATSCNSTSQCPEDSPCCDQFGECGTGTYCLGGCNPAYSYSIEACMPMPVCKNVTTVFDDSSSIISQDDYLGDPDDGDWYYTGYLADYDDAMLIAMPNQTSGTVLSSTRFVWYGKVGATFKTSRGSGVVTAFIMFSNIEDEIDWEFVGYNLTEAESNYYYEAVLNYTNVRDAETTDTFENYHTYEIDWQEDELKWYLDGELVRTLTKEDTYNSTSDSYMYPQTPSRIQFSLWPVTSSSSSGTIEWSGGTVDWDSDDIEDYGYFYVTLANATIECYDPPAGTLVNGSTSYVYNDTDNFNQEYVMITDDTPILCSDDYSGLDNDEDECQSSSSSASSSSKTSTSSSGTGSTSSSTGTSTSTDSDDDSSTSTTSTYTATGFVQFAETSSSSNKALSLTISGPFISTIALLLSYVII